MVRMLEDVVKVVVELQVGGVPHLHFKVFTVISSPWWTPWLRNRAVLKLTEIHVKPDLSIPNHPP